MADILALEARVGPDGRRYLGPGPRQEHRERFILNPSYLAPAWYRLFHEESGDPRWLELIESSYHLLGRLQEGSPVGLVPDWCELNGGGEPTLAAGFSRAYGWDGRNA